jgi:hypothetical protein
MATRFGQMTPAVLRDHWGDLGPVLLKLRGIGDLMLGNDVGCHLALAQ